MTPVGQKERLRNGELSGFYSAFEKTKSLPDSIRGFMVAAARFQFLSRTD